MADLTALLQQLGFSEYEARAYLAWLQSTRSMAMNWRRCRVYPARMCMRCWRSLRNVGQWSASTCRAGRDTRRLPRQNSPGGSRVASRRS